MTQNLKYSYFPGCSLHSTAKEYDLSTKEVARALGIELTEIPDWICCGATPAHITMHLLSIALPVKNLLQAKKMGSAEVATCCAACFSRLKIANKLMREDLNHRSKVNEIVDQEYTGDIKVRHFLDILVNLYGLKNISEKVTKRMEGLKVACYYGCLLTRPGEITGFDDLENPSAIDNLMHAIGVDTLDWAYKTECCGAGFSLSKTDIVLKLSCDILQAASDEGAQAIIVACPLCQSNLDLRQPDINKAFNKNFNIPVLYFTQMIGLSLGLDPESLGLEKHIIDPLPLLGSHL